VVRHHPAAGSAATDAVALKHHEFFRALETALRQSDVFRGMLGPADPRHTTHLHLDMGPWPYERL
jgi:hypothetical protein